MRKKIILITPSLKGGGLERVVSTYANYGSKIYDLYIVCLDNSKPFYTLESNIKVFQPRDLIANRSRFLRMMLLPFWIRRTVKNINGDACCSFGEKYNSFVILSLLRLKIQLYAANRASTVSSLNGFTGLVNPLFYRATNGVFVQTQYAKRVLQKRYKHCTLIVLGYPFSMRS